MNTRSASKENEDFGESEEFDVANNIDNSNFLCLLNKNEKLGAAYYSFYDKTLNMFEDMSDLSPEFLVSSTLFRELAPKYVLTFGHPTDKYVQALISFCSPGNHSIATSNVSRLPENFFLTSLREYSYESCKTTICNIRVASNIMESADQKQEMFLRSCISFDQKLSIQALGVLFKYLEKHWSAFGVDPGEDHILHLNQVTLKNHILIDCNIFKSLQIFTKKSHDGCFKRGEGSSCREGLSIFKMFVSGCKSRMGQNILRNILLTPINDMTTLEKRLSFIEFIQHPCSSEYADNVQDNIKQLRNTAFIGQILEKIFNEKATSKNWETIYNAIYCSAVINDMSKQYRTKVPLLVDLNNAINEHLLSLQETINNALDFNATTKLGRPVIKFGLDEQLDAKRLHREDMGKHVTAAARLAANDLPDYIDECKVTYLPEMGHLMAIKEWELNCDPQQLNYLHYEHMFTIGNVIHYKTPVCVELDNTLGDINTSIIDHENRILRRLSSFTLKYNQAIRDVLKIIALMDCLIAIAKVSQQYNYVKPELNDQGLHEIIECRHPLMEQILTSFEPNSFLSGGSHSRIKIITGPNGSGKSLFLKQVLLNVYLAHVGCYVPAKSAKIGMVDSIHCRLNATESAAVHLSSFMVDIIQTFQAINFANASSFIILDEFGRGTLDDDGLILLTSLLKYFLARGALCPHILVATHLHRITNHLKVGKYVEYLKMDHIVENKTFCFLHQVSKGVTGSYALDIARSILGEEVIGRAAHYLNLISEEQPISLPPQTVKMQAKLLTEEVKQEEEEQLEI